MKCAFLCITAIMLFSSCGGEVEYPVTMNFSGVEETDFQAYTITNGSTTAELDTDAFATDADLDWDWNDIDQWESLILHSETEATLIADGDSTHATFIKDGNDFSFTIEQDDFEDEQSVLIGNGDEDEMKFSARKLKLLEPNSGEKDLGDIICVASGDPSYVAACGDIADVISVLNDDLPPTLQAIWKDYNLVMSTND